MKHNKLQSPNENKKHNIIVGGKLEFMSSM